jgi:hypothetical protein
LSKQQSTSTQTKAKETQKETAPTPRAFEVPEETLRKIFKEQ